MCFAKYLRDDLLVWMENIGPFRGNDIFEAQNTNTSPRHSLSSTDLRDEAAARIEPQNYPNDDPHFKAQNDDVHQRSPSTRIEKPSPKFNTYYLNLGLSSQIHTLQQDVVGLLRCEDRASKTIREMEEDAKTRKKTTDQAEAEMQHQINEYKHQIEAAEQDKIRVANENANAISAHEDRLREVKNEMEVQRQAAERRSTEVENKHTEDMSAANKKITELQNKQTITINSQRDFDDLRQQLSEAGKRKAEELSAKDLEIATLKTAINDRDAEICRLGTDTESAGEARRTLIREKNDLAHALAGVQRRVDRLGTENGRLVSERENIESKAANAEGRARGFQDQLKAVRTRAEQSERLHQEAVEE